MISIAGRYAEPDGVGGFPGSLTWAKPDGSLHNVQSQVLQLFEPSKDIGLVTLDDWADIDRRGCIFESPPLHLKVCLDVRFERFEVRVAQDVFDRHRRDPCLQHV